MRHHKVAEFLHGQPAEVQAQYEALLRNPASTVEDLFGWLLDQGYDGGRTSVHTHRRSFSETLEGVRRSAELARAFASVARTEGIEGVSDAALMRMQQVLMEQSFLLDAQGDLDPADLVNMTNAIGNVIKAKRHVEALRQEFEAKQKAALEAAQKAAAGGAAASDVVATIKQALGISA
jgi:hypothetical protein